MKKNIVLILIFVITLGCSYKDRDKLIIGIIKPSLNHLPLDVGLAKEVLHSDQYIIKEFASGWETNEALISGKIDVAIMPFTYTWLDVANGHKVRIISFFERESDGIITRPGITKLDHMKDKRIGVLRASTLDVFAELISRERNVNMEFIYFRTPMDMAAALQSGEVDALSFYVPSIFRFPEDHNIIYWYGDDQPLHTCCDISATVDAIRLKRTLIRDFLNGLDSTLQMLYGNAEPVYRTAEEFYNINPLYLERSLQHTKFVMGLDERMKEFELAAFNVMIDKGYAEQSISPEDVYFKIK